MTKIILTVVGILLATASTTAVGYEAWETYTSATAEDGKIAELRDQEMTISGQMNHAMELLK